MPVKYTLFTLTISFSLRKTKNLNKSLGKISHRAKNIERKCKGGALG